MRPTPEWASASTWPLTSPPACRCADSPSLTRRTRTLVWSRYGQSPTVGFMSANMSLGLCFHTQACSTYRSTPAL